jgi:hypothetical protein
LIGPFPDGLFEMVFRLTDYNFKENNFDVDKKSIKGVFINEFTNLKDQTIIDLNGRGLTGNVIVC